MHLEDGQEDQHLRSARRTVTRRTAQLVQLIA